MFESVGSMASADGAVILMAGVLLFCHAELRGAQYINRMHAILDDIDIELDGTPARQAAFEEAFFTAQQREKMDESWNSFLYSVVGLPRNRSGRSRSARRVSS